MSVSDSVGRGEGGGWGSHDDLRCQETWKQGHFSIVFQCVSPCFAQNFVDIHNYIDHVVTSI